MCVDVSVIDLFLLQLCVCVWMCDVVWIAVITIITVI